MVERTAAAGSTVGLHARPAVISAGSGDLEITINAGGEPADDAMDTISVLSPAA